MLERLKKIWTLGWMDIALIEIEIAGYTIEIAFGEPVPNTTELLADVNIDITPEVEMPAALEGEITDHALESAIADVSANDMADAVSDRLSDCVYLSEPAAMYAAIASKPLVVELMQRMKVAHGDDYAAPFQASLDKAFQETSWVMSFVPKPGEHAVSAKRFRLKTQELLVMVDGLNLLTPTMEDEIVGKAIELTAPHPEAVELPRESPRQKKSARAASYPKGNGRRSHRTAKKTKTFVRQAFLKVDLGRAHLLIQPDS